MINKILFPVDGSEHSRKAMPYVQEFASDYNVEVVVFNAYYLPQEFHAHESKHYVYLKHIEDNMIEKGKKILEEVKNDLEAKNIKVKTVLEKTPAGPGIVKTASEEGCNMIIMSNRGLGNIKSMIISSVSNYVVHHSTCPVLLVK